MRGRERERDGGQVRETDREREVKVSETNLSDLTVGLEKLSLESSGQGLEL
jgi:hypothetical protein